MKLELLNDFYNYETMRIFNKMNIKTIKSFDVETLRGFIDETLIVLDKITEEVKNLLPKNTNWSTDEIRLAAIMVCVSDDVKFI
jgi:hypothetical protein